LLLQRLTLLGDQPRILHRDDRLSGEVLQQRDLLIVERPHFLAVNVNCPEHVAISRQRHVQRCTGPSEIDIGAPQRLATTVKIIVLQVERVDVGFSGHDACEQRILGVYDWMVAAPLGKRVRQAMGGNGVHLLALFHGQNAECRFAKSHCLVEQDVEHRLKLAGRAVDRLQNLGNRLLLFQRLALFGQEPCILHRDHRLGSEILQQCDLFIRKRPHFLAAGHDAA
jgi:hypothetical protein